MHRILLLVLLVAGFYSCVPHKKIILLQNSAALKDSIEKVEVEYKIQTKDRLYIRVSSFNSEVTQFFNLQNGQQGSQMNVGGAGGSGMFLLNSYLVKQSGYIEIPMLDSIKIQDLTLEQVQDTLTKALREQVLDAFVLVSLANYQVTVMQEDGGQAVVNTRQNRITILEALAEAGGLSEYADRKHVKIIRKTNDKYIYAQVDLTNRNLILSEYFYLHPNDVVYVERLRSKTILNNLNVISRVVGTLVGFALLTRFIP